MTAINDLLVAIGQGKITEEMAADILAEVFKEGPVVDLVMGAQRRLTAAEVREIEQDERAREIAERERAFQEFINGAPGRFPNRPGLVRERRDVDRLGALGITVVCDRIEPEKPHQSSNALATQRLLDSLDKKS